MPMILTDGIDYLQRSGFDSVDKLNRRSGTGEESFAQQQARLALEAFRNWPRPALSKRQIFRVRSIGRLVKLKPTQAAGRQRPAFEDLINGLHGQAIGFTFSVTGADEEVKISFGALTERGTNDEGEAVIRAVLESQYPYIKCEPAVWPPSNPFSKGGLVLGMPTAKPADPNDGALPIDRLIRAMRGLRWGSVIIAQPVNPNITRGQRIKTQREITHLSREEGARSNQKTVSDQAVERYIGLLNVQVKALMTGEVTGAWRTAVYLLGDEQSYSRLAALWRGIFSGAQSEPEPIRVLSVDEVLDFAATWTLPEVRDQNPPESQYRHLFATQTLLNSSQLATYVHLPRLEVSGFRVETVPEFDVEPPEFRPRKADDAKFPEFSVRPGFIPLGRVLNRRQTTNSSYSANIQDLTKHCLIAGVTGAGKTNTIFHLLKESWKQQIPFLVLEPAKSEYLALLEDRDLKDYVRVFTLGDERVSPFRLNPFEALEGTTVGQHLDLLRSAFAAGFGMWTPLPQVLEKCLYRIYEDRGWDITTDRNYRVKSPSEERALSFPLMSDLADAIIPISDSLQYDPENTAIVKASLSTRIDALRIGGKGRMLDTHFSVSMEDLLNYPTILELDGMGDDDDKAFLMGLILIRLIEYRRRQGKSKDLRHLLVVEEAHRLLTNVPVGLVSEQANPRGKAVETFSNLLAEVRDYGQGIIIADQVPTKLAPDVIKNTNLKIAHRIVAKEDREALGAAMNMDQQQIDALAILSSGEAACFSEGDDTPVLVKIKPVKDLEREGKGTGNGNLTMREAAIRDRMRRFGVSVSSCDDCSLPTVCSAARELARDDVVEAMFARLALAIIDNERNSIYPREGGSGQQIEDFENIIWAKCPPGIDRKLLYESTVAHASARLVRRRGAQAGWPYKTSPLKKYLCAAILKAGPAKMDPIVKDFRKASLLLFRKRLDASSGKRLNPFPRCDSICPDESCLYRFPAEDLIETGVLDQHWSDAINLHTADENEPHESGESKLANVADVACTAALQIMGNRIDSKNLGESQTLKRSLRRAALCFGQQMLVLDMGLAQSTRNYCDDIDGLINLIGPEEG